jgi:hypothetical protein
VIEHLSGDDEMLAMATKSAAGPLLRWRRFDGGDWTAPALELATVQCLDARDGHIALYDSTRDAIDVMEMASGAVRTIARSLHRQRCYVAHLAIHGGAVYFNCDRHEGRCIMRAPLDGSRGPEVFVEFRLDADRQRAEELARFPRSEIALFIQVDGDWLYWTNFDALARVALPR